MFAIPSQLIWMQISGSICANFQVIRFFPGVNIHFLGCSVQIFGLYVDLSDYFFHIWRTTEFFAHFEADLAVMFVQLEILLATSIYNIYS